ncbi:hypothetical protein ACIPRI_17140 [Variovorax sp. LARHSF232]
MKQKILGASLALVMAVLVAGCGGGGGGGGGDPMPVATEPPAQGDPLDKMMAFVKAMIEGAPDSGSEPADVSAFDPPPRSDATESMPTTTQ